MAWIILFFSLAGSTQINMFSSFYWFLVKLLIQPINFAKILSQISADIQYSQNCLSTVYKSQIFSYICEWRYEFRFERHYILRRCFSPAQPKIWTIFVLQSMGSVVNTPPVSLFMWSVGFFPLRTPYWAGVGYDCFFLLCVCPERSVEVTKTASHLCYFLASQIWSRLTRERITHNMFVELLEGINLELIDAPVHIENQ